MVGEELNFKSLTISQTSHCITVAESLGGDSGETPPPPTAQAAVIALLSVGWASLRSPETTLQLSESDLLSFIT